MKGLVTVFVTGLLMQVTLAKSVDLKSAKLNVLKNSLFTSLMKGGDRTGSGGQGIVCRDPVTKKFTSAYLRDYAEAKIKNANLKIDLGGSKLSVKQKVIMLMDRVKEFDMRLYTFMSMPIFVGADGAVSQNGRSEFLENLENFKNTPGDVVSFISDYDELKTELTPIDDATSNTAIINKQNCGYKQFASQNAEYTPGEPLIAMDKKIVGLLSKDDYAGAIFHELLIFAYNALKNEPLESTDNLRAFNAMLATNRFHDRSLLKFHEMTSQELFNDWMFKIDLADRAELRFGSLGLELLDVPVERQSWKRIVNEVEEESDSFYLVGNSYLEYGYHKDCDGFNCRDENRYLKIEKNPSDGNSYMRGMISLSSGKKSVVKKKTSNFERKPLYANYDINQLLGAKITTSYYDDNNNVRVLEFNEQLVPQMIDQRIQWVTYSAKDQDLFLKDTVLSLPVHAVIELRSLSVSEGPSIASVTILKAYTDEELSKHNIETIKRYDNVSSCLANTSSDVVYKIVTKFKFDLDHRIESAEESCYGYSVREK